jgi:hypothetical protein
MNFFPFTFGFEEDVAEFVYEHMHKDSVPGTVAFHQHPVNDSNHKGLPSSLVTKINNELHQHKLLPLGSLNAWRRQPGEVQVLHADVYAWDKVYKKDGKFAPNKVAFNIPVSNTRQSKMVWYGGAHILKETKIVTPTGAHSTFYNIEWKDEPFVESELELLSPHFVRTDKPHRVYAGSDGLRIVASIRLQGNPSFEHIHSVLFGNEKH